MTTPASLIKRPEPDPEFVRELAKQNLISLVGYCEEATGDERLHRYHECQARIHELAAESDTNLTSTPKGKPRPDFDLEPDA